MKLNGKVSVTLIPDGKGGATIEGEMSKILAEDGSEFFGGMLLKTFPPFLTPAELPQATAIIESINGLKIESLDDLIVAQAKIAEAVMDFNGLRSNLAEKKGAPVAKAAPQTKKPPESKPAKRAHKHK